MKRPVISIIFISLGVVLVLAYLLFSAFTFRIDEQSIRCRDLNIEISGKIKLMNEQEVNQMLADIGLHPVGNKIKELATEEIESYLEQNPIVKRTNCYHTPDGRATLKIELRQPKYMVVGDLDTYYVDTEKQVLPVPTGVIAYVPVVTGRMTRTMAAEVLFPLVSFIADHPFWNAQISQIYVNENQEIELVPRVGNTIILLGKTDGFEDKFERLYELYSKGFTVFGWELYEKLDLRYKQQIVGVRSKKAG
jgi:cell division protein FtsQ